MKRYAIVRVDNHCPEGLYENIKPNTLCPKDGDCEKCNYGDTKEQLGRKVAQVMFKNAPKETYQPRYVEQKRKILEVAKEIVEFLGVE